MSEWRHEGETLVRWNQVRLTLTTHSAGGLTENDHDMARRIDDL